MVNPFDEILDRLDQLQEQLNELKGLLPDKNPIRKYSVQELANETPLGAQTIRSLIQDGTIKAQRLGNKYLITPEEFNRVCQEARSMRYKRK